jgi:site-specific recombinase XerD
VTGSGKARRFEDVRDHAIIRTLTEGVRRTELIQLQTNDLSTDLIAQPFVRVLPLKGGREYTDGRIVPLTGVTARAVVAYLRVASVVSPHLLNRPLTVRTTIGRPQTGTDHWTRWPQTGP